jgi:hypothetical protein
LRFFYESNCSLSLLLLAFSELQEIFFNPFAHKFLADSVLTVKNFNIFSTL